MNKPQIITPAGNAATCATAKQPTKEPTMPRPDTAEKPVLRSWEQKPHAQLCLYSRAGMEQNDDQRLTFLRLVDLREQRRLFNRLWKDGFPYFITTGPTPLDLLRGSTLSLLPSDLAAAFSLALAPFSQVSGKLDVFVHADEAAVAVYRRAWEDYLAKNPEWERDNGN